jgi:hypothetical protein
VSSASLWYQYVKYRTSGFQGVVVVQHSKTENPFFSETRARSQSHSHDILAELHVEVGGGILSLLLYHPCHPSGSRTGEIAEIRVLLKG